MLHNVFPRLRICETDTWHITSLFIIIIKIVKIKYMYVKFEDQSVIKLVGM